MAASPRPKTFATLGPAGSNHELATRRYMAFHGVEGEIRFIERFSDALDLMLAGEVDFIVQVCAHPEVAHTIERNFRDVHIVDTFIAPTRPMGVVTRRDVAHPRSVGYMVATAGYFDPEQWEVRVPVVSNSRVAQGLLAGEYDSGFTLLEVARQHPERFRIDKEIGEVDVGWMVYARERVRTGDMLAWRDSPAAALLRA